MSGRALRTFLLRTALGIAGLFLVGYLVRSVGAERVWEVLLQAGPWLPVVLALEVVQLVADVGSLRVILGAHFKSVPAATWVRSSATAYAMMILVPAGRAAGEVTRAALLSTHIGAARAATASTQLQAAYLSANGLLSLVEMALVATFLGFANPLALLLGGNVIFQAIVSTALLAILWDARVGRWLERMRKRFAPRASEHPPLDPAFRRSIPWRAFLVSSASRGVQLVQYGIILYAVGGVPVPHGAVIAHGIHLVGATLGDLLPNQLGVVDGTYRALAGDLGFADAPARALSIALVARIAQLTLAALCVVVASVMRPADSRAPASSSSADAGARS
ncbi:MAG TPA: lysylphosphatidylglycerol synthase domain-containing protein [Polyangiaceae bacterium]|nr:lysylphosphatidylglycerol synthase domain-containing protein [Polyangiaceae bacterium]